MDHHQSDSNEPPDSQPMASTSGETDRSSPRARAETSESSDTAERPEPANNSSDPSDGDDDDEDKLLSYDPTPSHNPYPVPKWFSVQ